MDFFGEPLFAPLTSKRLIDEVDQLVANAQLATQELIWSDGPGEYGHPTKGLYGTPQTLYRFGLGCLALRAVAVAEAKHKFSAVYSRLCRQHELHRFDSSARRHSMYFPILAEDDGFREIVSETSKQLEWLFKKPFVGTEQVALQIKSLRVADEAIDWLPFGGMPRGTD